MEGLRGALALGLGAAAAAGLRALLLFGRAAGYCLARSIVAGPAHLRRERRGRMGIACALFPAGPR